MSYRFGSYLTMRKFSLLILAVCMACIAFAVPKDFKVLYLIPFDSESYESPFVKECEDMDRVMSYRLMGFWNGSQMALEELSEDRNFRLDVIVRDISNDERKLRNILDDSELMSDVDLIIGPFFGKPFEIAAEYAKRYQIPIVNPFTNRQDFLTDNEYVYKLTPPLSARPAMISFMAQQENAFPIILYGDSASSDKEMNAFVRYFQENGIAYEVTSSASTVTSMLTSGKRHFVVTFYDNPARNLIISRNLIYGKKTDNLTFVVPESWLDSKTYDIEYYSKLNLHFFSNYYVDYDAESTKTFVYDYTQRFGVPPTVQNFAFQGYDVTRYFLEFLNAENDVDRVKVTPISFQFSFDKVPGGGFENVNVQFLEVKDNEIVPSIY